MAGTLLIYDANVKPYSTSFLEKTWHALYRLGHKRNVFRSATAADGSPPSDRDPT
jgi:hypothetical protein